MQENIPHYNCILNIFRLINRVNLLKLKSFMHAYILIGRDRVQVKESINNLVEKLKGNPLEFSIEKIEMVRDLVKFLRFSQSENTIIIIKDVDMAGTEAVSAFLKNLEEPPNS